MATLDTQDETLTAARASLTRRDLLAQAALGAGAVVTLAALGPASGVLGVAEAAGKTVNIGAKDFSENQLVAHMYTLLLGQAGIPVKEHFGISGAATINAALIKGDLDLYPEYTGTAVEVILGAKAPHTGAAYYKAAVAGYKKMKLTYLAPAPMNDTQGLAVPQAVSAKYGIKTISDMVKNASKLRFIVNAEFLSPKRADGLVGLKKVYGPFSFKSQVVIAGNGSVRYRALREGKGDVVVAFTTDAAIAGDKLVVLSDDKGYAPPDNLAPVCRDDILAAYPQIKTILNGLAPKITSAAITQLNYQADILQKDISAIAKTFLQQQGSLKK